MVELGTHVDGVHAGRRPSRRCLAWHLCRNGYRVSADLLGDDQPEG